MMSIEKQKGRTLLAAFALLACGAVAQAGDEMAVGGHAFSIGPRASYGKAKDADEGVWFGGLQARFGLGEVLGLEGSIDVRKDDFPGDFNLVTYPVQASLLAYLAPEAPVSPYILAGGGWYHSTLEGPDDYHETSQRFGPHAGAGLEIGLGENLSLDGSYRYVWLKDLDDEGENELGADYNDSGYMVTMALNVKF